MGINGGVPLAAQYAGQSASVQARAALSEAPTELRRLIQDPHFDGTERALADLGGAAIGSDLGVDTVRKLRQWSAEYQRVAIELEAAARYCRVIEREINQRADALLEMPSAKTRRRAGPFRELLRRGRTASQLPAEVTEAVTSEPGPVPEPKPGPMPGPVSAVAATGPPALEVDIAASALGPLEVRVAGRRV